MEAYIRPPSYDEDLDRIRNGRCEGTGGWLLQDEEFVKWLEGKDQTFWLQGIPGAGKHPIFIKFTLPRGNHEAFR